MHAIAVSDRLKELGESTTVVLITFTDPESLKRYQDKHQLGFPSVSDHERSVYTSYGLGRGKVTRIWGPSTMMSYIKIFLKRGFRDFRMPKEDSLQLGGDFIIAPDGTIAWGYWCAGPNDRPTVDELVEAVTVGST